MNLQGTDPDILAQMSRTLQESFPGMNQFFSKYLS